MVLREIVNVTIDGMSLLVYLFSLIICWFSLDKMQKKNQIFMLLVICSFVKALLDAMYCMPDITNNNIAIKTTLKFLYMIMNYIGTFVYNYFLYASVGKQKKVYDRVLLAFYFGMIVSIVLATALLYTGKLFVFDETGFLLRSKYSILTNIYLVVAYFADIFILATVKMEKKQKTPLVIYSIVVFVTMMSSSLFLRGYSILSLMEFFLVLVVYANIFYAQIIKVSQHEKKLTENKIEIMVSQIQPHFLYNTLNSISALCDFDPQEAKNMTIKFSEYLRGNLDVLKDQNLTPLSKELEHIKVYLDIEKKRFGDRLNVEYNAKADYFFVPKLSVQPFVENAVKHGVCKKREGGTVTISSFESEDGYTIIVEDDGVGFDVDNPVYDEKSNNVGISNSIFRLEERCHAKVTVESEIGKGTKVTVFIPK